MARSALILEDSKTQAQIMCRMLEKLGWLPVHCEDVRAAIKALSHMKIEAMFLDIFLGGDNTLLHIDRFRKLGRNMPLVLMTAGSSGHDLEQTLERARRSGADHVLKKPFSEQTIAAILADINKDCEAGGKRRHVLVIDDSQTVRAFVRQALIKAGYRVSEANSMEAAFASVDIAHIDVALCDVFMPGMGGLMGIHQIKSTWPDVKIIAMSAGLAQKIGGQAALDATRRLGADAQLTKPFTPADLTDLLAALFEADDGQSAHLIG